MKEFMRKIFWSTALILPRLVRKGNEISRVVDNDGKTVGFNHVSTYIDGSVGIIRQVKVSDKNYQVIYDASGGLAKWDQDYKATLRAISKKVFGLYHC